MRAPEGARTLPDHARISRPAPRILLATATATFGAGVDAGSAAWTSVAGMIENGVSAILAELEPPSLRGASANSTRLLRRAHVIIRARHRDSAFSPRALATELSVSTSGLYFAFSETGVTPAQAIRSARAASARAMLDRRRSPAQLDLDEVAELAGFSTTAKMVAALRAS
ncbi:helix-turn-helix domain-containing protein [Rathayibacter sp. VKM Ac-2803]|uniref:helix-turn-helix domain-containing protein n=1 Tax=unclassified Rathayibacter TaxID=2609250 RepID=UPI00135A3D37|nr:MULTISPECIES: helix-turn-helix domain-containing protein [unclassified Rathayibacter]MWV48102.1 helix-turn-helix domain-containing protein [Rathayibacter sp. VKM Ac-2803]MWV59405.1 helix-turn-helix domain-containing protein [Rathayibacter sp. VKM Ac-2754]